MKFGYFEKGKQKEFLKEIKNKSQKNWREIGKEINRSKSMIMYYLREDKQIPLEIINQLKKTYNIQTSIKLIKEIKYTQNNIKIPKLNSKFAELIGAIYGDGHLHEYPTELNITCHKTDDKEYIEYLKTISTKLFKKEPKITIQKNTIKLRYYSKQLVKELNKKYGIPIGKKKYNLKIPKELSKKNLKISFIRGVFDTDGSIYKHHKNRITIEICSRDEIFLEELNKLLKELKFKVSKGYKSIKIYQKEEIKKFFKIIKPSNIKHTNKFEMFKKEGRFY
jgi:DNA-binding transcriptional regulator WhiA